LGIRVTTVEPGLFRTRFAGDSATYTACAIADYAPTVGEGLKAQVGRDGHQVGDPAKAAEALYQLVRLDEPPVHLLLGGPAYQLARQKFEGPLREFDEFAYLGEPTDF